MRSIEVGTDDYFMRCKFFEYMIVYMYMYFRIISGIFLQTFCSCRSARIEQLGDESVRFVHLDDSVPSVGWKHRSFSSATTDDNSSCIQTNIPYSL